MQKMVLFRGGVETLTYFSEQLAAYFETKGISIFWYDIRDKACSKRLRKFIKPHETVMLTFNFLGLSGEEGVYDEDKGYVWEQYDVPCINIMVDHPLYYADRLEQVPPRYAQIVIDREHERYLREYYRELDTLGFCPLAGTSVLTKEARDALEHPMFTDISDWMNERPMDVVFTGNFNSCTEYEHYITRINEEYTAFYRGMISELLHHPKRSLTEVAKRHCIREMGQLSIEEWRDCFKCLNFIDLYLRAYMREQVLKALLDAGVKVHVYGHGYENLKVKRKECLVEHGPADSKTCLDAMTQAKISLNVMPWFREGAHDRIFNAMANGSVSLTDSSTYLDEVFTDGDTVLFYDLLHLEEMADRVKKLLEQPRKLYDISARAYRECSEKHLWKQRGEWILDRIRENI